MVESAVAWCCSCCGCWLDCVRMSEVVVVVDVVAVEDGAFGRGDVGSENCDLCSDWAVEVRVHDGEGEPLALN